MNSEPKYIYVKSLAEFNANIRYFNGTVFWREVLDNKGNNTGWVEIKIASNIIFNDGESVSLKVSKLKGGWYKNDKL